MNTMDSIVKHSTSAVDATGCIKVVSIPSQYQVSLVFK